jgi:small subunit ribosomal protein S2
MLEAGAHFGHKTKYWNPKMSPYIYGERNGIHIINLETTIPMLSEACDFVQTIASQSGTILFVGTKISVKNEIKDAGVECKMPYVSNRWLGGTLTNNQTISKSIKKLEVIEESLKEENTNNLSKKEILTLSRSYQKLDKGLGGIRDMKKIPDAIFIIDVNYEKNAVKEAIVLGIPIIAIVDTNSSPDGINYVIPSNDDSRATAKLITSVIKDSFLAGKKTIPILDNIDDEFVEVDDEGKIDASKVKRKRKIIINKKELVKETPVEETPVEETPVEENLVEETPVEENLVEETPVEETPVEENLVEETPVEEGNKK